MMVSYVSRSESRYTRAERAMLRQALKSWPHSLRPSQKRSSAHTVHGGVARMSEAMACSRFLTGGGVVRTRLIGAEAEQDAHHAAEERVRERGERGHSTACVDVDQADGQRPCELPEQLATHRTQDTTRCDAADVGAPLTRRVALRCPEKRPAVVGDTRKPAEVIIRQSFDI